MTLPAGFLDKVNSPVIEVDRSVFRDRNGTWAKDWPEVVSVFVEFDDGTFYTIEPADFRAMTREQQTKIRNAPSSPLPE